MCNFAAALGMALLLAPDPAPANSTAADAVTLRDGKVVLGQVVEPSPRGTLQVLVRRDWAEASLPERARRWQSAEAGTLRRAVSERKDRLAHWREERESNAAKDDVILGWIDRENLRLSDPAGLPRSTLLLVKLNRGEVRSIVRRPKSSARLLRQGWLTGFKNVEAMPLQTLKDALEDRGFAVGGEGEVAIDRLLPLSSETEAQWLARRAATEVSIDPGLRFLRKDSLVIPEPAPGQPLELGAAASILGDIARLLDDKPRDPLDDRLREVAARGRIGAVVTRLEIDPDLTTVSVESTLFVRGGKGWSPAGSRAATVRLDDLGAAAGKDIADDPQVKTIFKVFDALGPGLVSEDLKRRSLSVGAATQKALGQVRSSSAEDLSALAFPVNESAEPPARPGRNP